MGGRTSAWTVKTSKPKQSTPATAPPASHRGREVGDNDEVHAPVSSSVQPPSRTTMRRRPTLRDRAQQTLTQIDFVPKAVHWSPTSSISPEELRKPAEVHREEDEGSEYEARPRGKRKTGSTVPRISAASSRSTTLRKKNSTLTQMDFVKRVSKGDDDISIAIEYLEPGDQQTQPVSAPSALQFDGPADGIGTPKPMKRARSEHDGANEDVERAQPSRKRRAIEDVETHAGMPVTPKRRAVVVYSSQSPESLPGTLRAVVRQPIACRTPTRSPLKERSTNVLVMPHDTQSLSEGIKTARDRTVRAINISQVAPFIRRAFLRKTSSGQEEVPESSSISVDMAMAVPSPTKWSTQRSESLPDIDTLIGKPVEDMGIIGTSEADNLFVVPSTPTSAPEIGDNGFSPCPDLANDTQFQALISSDHDFPEDQIADKSSQPGIPAPNVTTQTIPLNDTIPSSSPLLPPPPRPITQTQRSIRPAGLPNPSQISTQDPTQAFVPPSSLAVQLPAILRNSSSGRITIKDSSSMVIPLHHIPRESEVGDSEDEDNDDLIAQPTAATDNDGYLDPPSSALQATAPDTQTTEDQEAAVLAQLRAELEHNRSRSSTQSQKAMNITIVKAESPTLADVAFISSSPPSPPLHDPITVPTAPRTTATGHARSAPSANKKSKAKAKTKTTPRYGKRKLSAKDLGLPSSLFETLPDPPGWVPESQESRSDGWDGTMLDFT